MRRIDSLEDEMRDIATYEVGDGRRVAFEGRAVRRHGIEALLREIGEAVPTERQPVFQWGREIGSVPGAFDPDYVKSSSFFYQPRRGDFTRSDRGWEAARTLGPGDLEAVQAFVWSEEEARARRPFSHSAPKGLISSPR